MKNLWKETKQQTDGNEVLQSQEYQSKKKSGFQKNNNPKTKWKHIKCCLEVSIYLLLFEVRSYHRLHGMFFVFFSKVRMFQLIFSCPLYHSQSVKITDLSIQNPSPVLRSDIF